MPLVPHSGEFIVMKEYNIDPSSSPEAAKRMELLYHEINLLRKSKHANIVRYLGTGNALQLPFCCFVRSTVECLPLRGALVPSLLCSRSLHHRTTQGSHQGVHGVRPRRHAGKVSLT